MTKSRGILPPRHVWTDAEKALMALHYPEMKAVDLAALLGLSIALVYAQANRQGLQKSDAFKQGPNSGRLEKGNTKGSLTRFRHGSAPWTKGVKGLHLGLRTEFKPGSVPANRQEVGALRINSLGDLEIKVAEGKGQWVSMRRYVWETEMGPIPDDMVVRVIDGDSCNTQLENLELVTRAQSIRLNLLNKYPKELRAAMQLGGRLRKRISKLQGECNV